MGPEPKDSTTNIQDKKDLLLQFDSTFADYPREIVGGPEATISLDSVKAALQRLGPRSNELFIITHLHGGPSENTFINDHQDLKTIYTNSLQGDPADSTELNSFELFKIISETISEDTLLSGMPLSVFAIPCHGEAGARDYAMLPNAEIVVLADKDNVSLTCIPLVFEHFDSMMSLSKDTAALSQKTIIPALIYTANTGSERMKNTPILFSTNDTDPDSVKMVYSRFDSLHVHHEHNEAVGWYGGTVINCSEQANNMLALYSEKEIYDAAEQSRVTGLSYDMVNILLRGLKNNVECTDVRNMDDDARGGWHYLLAYAIAKQYLERQKTIAQHVMERNMAAPVKPEEEFQIYKLPKPNFR